MNYYSAHLLAKAHHEDAMREKEADALRHAAQANTPRVPLLTILTRLVGLRPRITRPRSAPERVVAAQRRLVARQPECMP